MTDSTISYTIDPAHPPVRPGPARLILNHEARTYQIVQSPEPAPLPEIDTPEWDELVMRLDRTAEHIQRECR